MVEKGVVFTDKGWAKTYTTKYYSPGFATPNGTFGFSSVIAKSSSYLPTFSDWKGAMVGFSGSIDFISGNVGASSSYYVFGLGLSYAPGSFSYMQETKGGGSMNVGVTVFTSDPFKVGDLNLPGADQRYINTMQYQGGY